MVSGKYVLDMRWKLLLTDMGISVQDVLRYARLPLDLLSRKSPTITADQYFRLWEGLSYITRAEPTFPLRMAEAITVEAFSPPIFACFCSSDLNVALQRIAHYKPLLGPLRLKVQKKSQKTIVKISGLPEKAPLPPLVITSEIVFWVQITRLATREHIVPKTVHLTIDLPEKAAYEAFFGSQAIGDTFNGITFAAEDAAKPFLTANDAMWSIFEPQLNMKMQDLAVEASFSDRVRACLMEMLASGQHSMADVASRLAISTRTLQRRLRQENTSFQKELDSLRAELARNYLLRSDYTSGQIGFLLGYKDPNSFFRAFRAWTGQTPDFIRSDARASQM